MAANVQSLRPLRTISPTRWTGRLAPDREWMIDGLCVRKTTCLFSGVGGIGKSLLAQQLMTACATGKQWLGRSVAHCKAFALFAEDPEEEVWRRQDGVGRHYTIEHGDLDDIDMMTLNELDSPVLYTASQKDPAGHMTQLWMQIEAFIRERGHQLVVLDNVNAIFGGNANYPEQVRPFLQNLNRLARDIDGLVLLIQHPSASGEADSLAQAGSRVWRNTVRSQIIMQIPKDEEEAEPSDDRVIRIGKNNYGRRAAPMRITWNDGVFVPVQIRDQGGSGRLNQFDQLELRSKILQSMRRMIAQGTTFSLAEKSRLHVASILQKAGPDWRAYSWPEIRSAADGLFNAGQLVAVTIGTGHRIVTYVRPTDVTYPGEGQNASPE
jgi:RecA-family ATPase